MRLARILLGAALPAFMVAAPLTAQDSMANADMKSTEVDPEVAASVEALSSAAGVAAYGYANQNALALVTAAQMIIDNPFDGTRTPDAEEAGEPMRQGEMRRGTVAEFSATQLLADAAELTRDENLLAIIESLSDAAEASKGSVNGPGSISRRIDAYSSRTFRFTLRGDEYTRIDVRGDGDTDLDCWLYDENGNEVDSDLDYTDWCILEVRPRWTGAFRLRVSNLGRVWNGAVISWN